MAGAGRYNMWNWGLAMEVQPPPHTNTFSGERESRIRETNGQWQKNSCQGLQQKGNGKCRDDMVLQAYTSCTHTCATWAQCAHPATLETFPWGADTTLVIPASRLVGMWGMILEIAYLCPVCPVHKMLHHHVEWLSSTS